MSRAVSTRSRGLRTLGSSEGPRRSALLTILIALCLAAPVDAFAQDRTWSGALFGARTRTHLQSDDETRREAAAIALGRHGEHGPAVAALVAALDTEAVPQVRRQLLVSLALRGGPEAAAGLSTALDGVDSSSSALAARALGVMGGQEAIAGLIRGLQVPVVSDYAVEALGEIGAPAAAPLLASMRDGAIVPAQVRALAQIGSAYALPKLIEVAGDHQLDPEVRLSAVEGLGVLVDERAAVVLSGLVLDDDPQLALAAMRALGELGSASGEVVRVYWEGEEGELPAIDAPIPIAGEAKELTSASFRRATALRVLIRSNPRSGAALLTRLAGSEDPHHVRLAAETARELRHPAMAPLLHGLVLDGEEPDEAAHALSRLEGGAGIPALLQLAADPSQGDRNRAATAALALALRLHGDEVSSSWRDRSLNILRALQAGPRADLLRAIARDDSVAPLIATALASEDPDTRAHAAYAAETLGSASLAEPVLSALSSEQDDLALQSLSRTALALGGVPSAGVVLRLLDRTPEVLPLAGLAEGTGSARARRRMRRALRQGLRHGDQRVRVFAARGLSLSGGRGASHALSRALEDRERVVRAAAVRGLVRLGEPAGLDALERYARLEPDAALRQQMRDGAAGRPLSLLATGDNALRVRVTTPNEATAVPVELTHPDGRVDRRLTLPSGELFVVDLPEGVVDLRLLLREAP